LHAADVQVARQATLAMEHSEPKQPSQASILPYEWVDTVAIQSLQPILDRESIRKIQTAAEALFADKTRASRFTYQFATNAEVHLCDINDTHVVEIVNRALVDKIYPLIQHVFLPDMNDASTNNNTLFVYDALVIRYNGTGMLTAGQPLHRDLGLVSVNIMLNDEFEGGGTYFENQIQTKPVKPANGVGHCLMHRSSERHAGAGTHAGVRDIMVLFISSVRPVPEIQSARLKQCRATCSAEDDLLASLLCRIQHHRLAIKVCNNDGEAFQYLGTALMEYADFVKSQQDTKHHLQTLKASILCLENSRTLTPKDARVYNNLGILFDRLYEKNPSESAIALVKAEEAYDYGMQLLKRQISAGCNAEADLDSLSLNYGLCLANQDRFHEAAQVLKRTAVKLQSDKSETKSRTISDGDRLYQFCVQQNKDTRNGSSI
jgi:hypothetical protein